MTEHRIESYITKMLNGDTQKNVLEFAKFLRVNDMQFERGGGYWADKLYWYIHYKGESVCYILIYSPVSAEDSNEPWVVWTDDSGSNWFADSPLDEQNKEIAWKNVDICGNSEGACGGCMGKSHKTVFGREFNNVCGITFRFNNPNTEAVECIKKLLKIRKNDIERNITPTVLYSSTARNKETAGATKLTQR